MDITGATTRPFITPQKSARTRIRTACDGAIETPRAGIESFGVSLHVRRALDCLAAGGAHVAGARTGPSGWRDRAVPLLTISSSVPRNWLVGRPGRMCAFSFSHQTAASSKVWVSHFLVDWQDHVGCGFLIFSSNGMVRSDVCFSFSQSNSKVQSDVGFSFSHQTAGSS